jgi:hypothetical protein
MQSGVLLGLRGQKCFLRNTRQLEGSPNGFPLKLT